MRAPRRSGRRPHHRVERGHRLLEDHRHAVAAQRAQLGAAIWSAGPRPRAGCARRSATSWRGGSRPMTACAVTDLPEPDSPTRQTISPAPTANETSSTALARSRAGAAAHRQALDVEDGLAVSHRHIAPRQLRIERVAQAVAQHVDGEHGEREEDAGEEDVVRVDAEQGAALGHDVAPGRRLGRHADAEERQDRLDQDRGGADEGALHDQRRDRVRQDVADRAAAASACRARSRPRRRAPRGSTARASAPAARRAGSPARRWRRSR